MMSLIARIGVYEILNTDELLNILDTDSDVDILKLYST